MAASHAAMTSGGVPFGPASPRNLRTERSMPCSLTVSTSGNCGRRSSPTTASSRILPASSCAADLLQLADAHVERVIQHVDQHVAAAFERGDGGRDAAFCFSRSITWRSSDAGLAAPHLPPPLRASIEDVLERLEPGVGGGVEHLGVEEEVHQRLEVRVARRRLAQERRVDERRRRRVEHAAVRLRAGDASPSPWRRCRPGGSRRRRWRP